MEDGSIFLLPPKGYPTEILNEVNLKYLCSICNKILCNPVQSFCGHRFCRACLEHKIRSSGEEEVNCVQCEAEDLVNEYSILKLDQTFPDNAIRREMMNCSVRCSSEGCDWNGSFKEYELHFTVCEWVLVPCQRCGKEFTRKEIEGHSCLGNASSNGNCPYGCKDKILTTLADHLNASVPEHLEILQQKISSIERITGKSADHSTGDHTLVARINVLESTVVKLSNQAHRPERQSTSQSGAEIGATRGMVPQIPAEALAVTSEKMAVYEGVITVLNREVEKMTLQIEAVERQHKIDREQLDTLDRKVKALERTLAMKDATIAELDLRISTLEQTSYDGTLLWRISDFQHRRQEAISGRSTSFYSPAFYTSRTGYKMCARIYLNGDGMGKGSHVSLFFVVMRGQYDALLKWPFRQKVTLMLLDQNGRDHVMDSFRPDPTSSSFKRPTTEMNIASGCPLLMSLTQLDSVNHAYVKDNVAYVKIVVNMDDI